MRIEVTADDIAKGMKSNCYQCPIALAIRRVTGDVFVGRWIVVNGKRFDKIKSVSEFIANFDDGRPVEPFSFHLPL